MQDNSKRGLRTIFWLKATIIVSVIVVVLGALAARFDYEQFQNTTDFSTIPGFAYIVCIGITLLLTIMGWCFVSGMGATFWALWMFRSEENLRKFTKTAFSPWGAVICTLLFTLIPVVGAILDYLIFKDLLNSHEKVLSAKGIEFNAVPRKFLKGMLVLCLLCTFIWVIPNVGGAVSSIVGVFAVVYAIKLVRGVMAYEKLLFDFDQSETLRVKVDEVLREREIEKAAAEIQAATYEVDTKPADDADTKSAE